MKADPDVKMISAEAPILFAKGCDIFITELTMRAWIHAEENKRRTLQRSDIASALAKSDMFDFLIDIVPREEAATPARKRLAATTSGSFAATAAAASHGPPGLPVYGEQPDAAGAGLQTARDLYTTSPTRCHKCIRTTTTTNIRGHVRLSTDGPTAGTLVCARVSIILGTPCRIS